MKIDIDTLKDTFKVGYETFEESRKEADEIVNLYHNRQYTDDQIQVLKDRGQPVETFNVIKMFGRMLLGYYSTVVNTVKITPKQLQDIPTAEVLNDLVNYTFRDNNFDSEGDKIKLDGLLVGLMCSYANVQPTGEKDQFGRPINKISIQHVPAHEIVLDPMSTKEDYSDARYIHRFKWITKDAMHKTFGKRKTDELESYYNHLNIEEAEYSYSYNGQFQGYYKVFDNYLVVHTTIEDDEGKVWSIFWSGDTILSKHEVTYREVKFPYRVHKMHSSNKAEYYGIFREVAETQKAINQALLKIQLMVNTQKAFVEDNAVDNLVDFTNAFNRVNAIIPVKDLQGIRIENLTREVIDQYTIIDKALDRIQRVLSINDSFLGMAYASDSGRKVKLQQNASVVALRYITSKVEQFYRLLGWDIANLIKQYYTAYQVVRIADEVEGQRWVEINKPMMEWTGQMDQQGQPIMRPVLAEVMDPDTGKPMLDEEGNLIIAPVPEEETEIAFSNVDVEISSVSYNDEDEKNQLMLESFLSGGVGNMLAQINPAGYFKAASMSIKGMKSKYSADIAAILEQTSQQLGGSPEAQMQAQQMAGGQQMQSRQSQSMKLPTNTNEGV